MGSGDNVKGNCLILIDDSYSMSALSGSKSYLELAKEKVRDIVESSKGYNCFIVPSSSIGKKNNESLTIHPDSVDKIIPSYKPFDINEGVNSAITKYTINKQFTEIFIISDFQKSNINKQKFDITENVSTIYAVKIGNRIPSNISIDSAFLKSNINTINSNVNISAIVRNHNDKEANRLKINLSINGESVSEKIADLKPFEVKQIELEYKTKSDKYEEGIISLDESGIQFDEIKEDNKYYLGINHPENIKVCIISDNKVSSQNIEQVINISNNIYGNKLFSDVYYSANIPSEFQKYDVMIISGKNSLKEDESGRIFDYLGKNKGVILFYDVNYNNETYNKFLSEKIAAFNLATEKNITSKKKYDLIWFDYNHPAIFGLLKTFAFSENINITPLAANYIPAVTELNKAYPLIKLSDNNNLMFDAGLSSGRLILFTLPTTNVTSNFPSTQLFAPLILRSIVYASGEANIKNNFLIGVNNLFNSADVYQILYSNEYQIPGVYKIKNKSTQSDISFSLNKNIFESIPSYYDENEIIEIFKKNGIKNINVINEKNNITDIIKGSREGYSTSILFIILSVLFIVTEIILSKYFENHSKM